MKKYIVLNTGQIGYIKNICNCQDCKARGEVEIFVNNLNGEFIDCIKYHELFDKSKILNVGNSVNDLTYEHSDMEIAKFFTDAYQEKMINDA